MRTLLCLVLLVTVAHAQEEAATDAAPATKIGAMMVTRGSLTVRESHLIGEIGERPSGYVKIVAMRAHEASKPTALTRGLVVTILQSRPSSGRVVFLDPEEVQSVRAAIAQMEVAGAAWQANKVDATREMTYKSLDDFNLSISMTANDEVPNVCIRGGSTVGRATWCDTGMETLAKIKTTLEQAAEKLNSLAK